MSYKGFSNYDIAMDIYQKVKAAKTTFNAGAGTIHPDTDQDHIDVAKIVEHLSAFPPLRSCRSR